MLGGIFFYGHYGHIIMIIKDFSQARHLASRLEMGIDAALCNSRIGFDSDIVFNDMLPPMSHIVVSPRLAGWNEMAVFYGAEIEIQREIRMQARMDSDLLTSWWLEQIHKTEYPLLERMTIFWHSHFTSDIDKVTWPQFMLWQNQLLRQHALGSFADMLYAITRDPAMLMFLDSAQNLAKSPNENFARELLELFTLGAGHYSEQDVVNAARAFTGWRVDLKKGEFLFQNGYHDNNEKTFMGRTGNFDGNDILNILLQESRTAEYIAEKFWAEFINHDQPDAAVIKSWAAEFRDSGYDIKTLLRTVISSEVFWREQNRGVLIKSPIEFTIGLMRELGIQVDEYEYLRRANQQLGQDLFRPPDVKGWRGGKQWITNTRLIRRYDLTSKLVSAHEGDKQNMLMETAINPMMMKTGDAVSDNRQLAGLFRKLLDKIACNAGERELVGWLLPLAPISAPSCKQSLESMVLTLLKDPTYQLR